MVKVIATSRGYFGSVIRDAGESFVIPDELWNDEKRRPLWAKLDPSSAFGGKGDHDGNGSVGGSKPKEPAPKTETAIKPPAISVPADWQNLNAADRKALAANISGGEVKKAAEADKIISDFVELTKPAPFSDAPEPETVQPAGNGVVAALGKEPDWLPPGSGEPKPVSD